MKLTKLSLALIGCTVMASGVAQAAGPTVSDVLGNSGITESGFIDGAYTSTDANTTLNSFSGGNPSTFNVQQAAIQLAKQPASGFGGLLNLSFGSDANVIRSSPDNGVQGQDFDVTQAFAQYTTGALTLQAGKFTTLAGAEVIAPTGNTNITRSIAFFQLPYTHTGTRATYAASSTLTLIGGVNNGWDQEQDLNKAKTLELGLAWAPTSSLSWTLQGYSGVENATFDVTNATPINYAIGVGSSPKGTRTLVDTVLTFKATSALTLILNLDYGKQQKGIVNPTTGGVKDATWGAVVGYANYQWTDKWRTSLRVEQFSDNDGYKLGQYTGTLGGSDLAINKAVKEATLTVGYAPDASFELRGEIRNDKADKKVFSPYSAGNATDSATTLAVEGLYKF